ncbi:hypothetical protein BD410DRAFT_535750 [Rickenella mellea]|uniref:Uncharacterized protein n=1 Tax=Rickenella mellea TaxID=50990 RepID=A0A4Y7PR79_9AGAM|nr:hypothetical protein BD410DRAFT_535750 [Rickenella mellea]
MTSAPLKRHVSDTENIRFAPALQHVERQREAAVEDGARREKEMETTQPQEKAKHSATWSRKVELYHCDDVR